MSNEWTTGWTNQETLVREDPDGTRWEIAPHRTLSLKGDGWMNCYKMTMTHPLGIYATTLHPTPEDALEHCDEYLRIFSRSLREWMDNVNGSVQEAEDNE